MENKELKKNNAGVSLRSLAKTMAELAAVEAQIKQADPDQDYLSAAKIAGMGIFRLVVMGEIKKGKSSFINALIGTRNLVPVHSDVATSTIFKIHYGPEVKYTVYFTNESNRESLEIDAGKLNEYGTEDGNPGNTKNVDYIRVQSPAPLLKNGLVVVDTPGVGGLFKEHREITFRHAPKADAVFFVTDSVESPIGGDEVKFLKELRQITPYIYFVQTKSSSVDSEARQARMKNNLDILENEAGFDRKDINYFIVDSQLKLEADQHRDPLDLSDSGFPPLMLFLNNTLRGDQERIVARQAIHRSMAKLSPLMDEMAQMKEIVSLETEEQRTSLEEEMSSMQEKLVEWDKSTRPHLLDSFSKQIQALGRKAKEDMSPLRPGGAVQSEFEEKIHAAEDVETVKLMLAGIDSDLAALTSEKILDIGNKFQHAAETLFKQLVEDADAMDDESDKGELAIPKQDVDKLWVNTYGVARIASRDENSSVFDTARTVVYGGGAGVMIAAVAGGVLGSVIPVVGTMIGSTVGMMIAGLWGSTAATMLKTKQSTEAIKRESSAAIGQALSTAYSSAMDNINELIIAIQSEAATALKQTITDVTERMVRQREELIERKNATQQEVAEKRKEVATLSKKLEQIQVSFKKYQQNI